MDTGVTSYLRAALSRGEVVDIRYDAGSQPGTVRAIKVIRVDEDSIIARCVASNSNKTFKTASCVVPGPTDTKRFDPARSIHAIRESEIINEPIAAAAEQIRTLGWDLEFDSKEAAVFKCRKSGARLKSPTVFVTCFPDQQRCFYVRSNRHPPARSYRSGAEAGQRFVELCLAAGRPEDGKA